VCIHPTKFPPISSDLGRITLGVAFLSRSVCASLAVGREIAADALAGKLFDGDAIKGDGLSRAISTDAIDFYTT
jgi:hypothetical protein